MPPHAAMKLSLSIRHGTAQNNADRRANSQGMQDIHETVSVGSQTAMAMEGKAEATERPWEGGCRAKRRGNGVYTHIYRIASCQCQHRHHPLPTEGLILLPYMSLVTSTPVFVLTSNRSTPRTDINLILLRVYSVRRHFVGTRSVAD